MAGKRVKVTVIAETKAAQRAFKQFAKTSGLETLASTAQTAGKAAGVAVTGIATAAAAAAPKLISLGSDLEQSMGAVEAVFKDSASQMKAWSNQAATSVGLSKNEYNELATIIGAQLKNAGTSMQDLGAKTNDLIGLGSDLSAMFGGTTKDAVDALSSALKGERDPIEAYGVSLKQAAIDAEAAALGYQKVGGTYDQTAQAAATLSLITKQTADAQGAFGRESDTVAHKAQVLKAQLENVATQIGSALLPAVSSAADWVSSKLLPAAQQAADYFSANFGPALKSLADTFNTNIKPALSDVANAFTTTLLPALGQVAGFITGTIIPAIVSFIQQLNQHKAAVIAVAAPILTVVAAWKAYQVVMAAINVAHKVHAAVTAAVTVAQTAYRAGIIATSAAHGGFIAMSAAVVGSLKAQAAALLTNVGAGARVVATWVAQTAAAAAHGIALGAAKVAMIATTAAQWAMNAAMSANPIGIVVLAIAALVAGLIYAYQHSETFRNAIQTAFNFVKSVIETVANWITQVAFPAIMAAFDWFKSLPGKFVAWFNGVKNAITNAIQAAWGVIKAFPGQVISGLASLGSRLWSTVSGAFNRMKTAVTSGINTAVSTIKQLPSKAVSSLGNLGSTLLNAGKNLIQGFINGVKNMFGSVKDTLGNLTSKLTSWKGPADKDAHLLEGAGKLVIGGFIDGLESQYNQVRKSLTGLTGMVASTAFDPLNLPAITATGYGLHGGSTQPVQPIINVYSLNPTMETGRLVAEALERFTMANGNRGVTL